MERGKKIEVRQKKKKHWTKYFMWSDEADSEQGTKRARGTVMRN